MKRAQAAFLLVLLVCLAVTARQIHKPNLADFQVYDAAAECVHEHQSVHMYDDADSEPVFQLKFASRSTPFAQAALRLGIPEVRLYIYPPILADLIVPFALLSARTAGELWLLVNFVALLLTALMMMRMLNLQPASRDGLAVMFGLLALFGTGMCLIWGQITIVLLLLWTAGLFFYQRELPVASALVFALATAIKLTPLLVVAPLLIWQEWRWLRAYLGFLLLFVLGMCVVNRPASLADYVLHVMPSMSGGGIPDYENKALLAAVQLFYVTLRGGATHPVTMAIPALVVTAGKAVSLAIVALAIGRVYQLGAGMRMTDRLLTLSLFAVLSVAIAPISWKHAYVVVFLALSFLWTEALRDRVSPLYLLFLSFCSIELGSFVFDSIALKITHGPVAGALAFLAPAASVALVFARLAGMRAAGPVPYLR